MSNDIDLESLRTAELKEAFDEFDKVAWWVAWWVARWVAGVAGVLVSCIQKTSLEKLLPCRTRDLP